MQTIVLHKSASKAYLKLQQRLRDNARALEFSKIVVTGVFMIGVMLSYGMIVNRASTIGYDQRKKETIKKNLDHELMIAQLKAMEVYNTVLSENNGTLVEGIGSQRSVQQRKVVQKNVYYVTVPSYLTYTK